MKGPTIIVPDDMNILNIIAKKLIQPKKSCINDVCLGKSIFVTFLGIGFIMVVYIDESLITTELNDF